MASPGEHLPPTIIRLQKMPNLMGFLVKLIESIPPLGADSGDVIAPTDLDLNQLR